MKKKKINWQENTSQKLGEDFCPLGKNYHWQANWWNIVFFLFDFTEFQFARTLSVQFDAIIYNDRQ